MTDSGTIVSLLLLPISVPPARNLEEFVWCNVTEVLTKSFDQRKTSRSAYHPITITLSVRSYPDNPYLNP